MQIDNRYSQLNRKIKGILDQDEIGDMQILKQTETVLNRSSILKKVDSNGNQQFISHMLVDNREIQGTNLPNINSYFLGCLKTKNSTTGRVALGKKLSRNHR